MKCYSRFRAVPLNKQRKFRNFSSKVRDFDVDDDDDDDDYDVDGEKEITKFLDLLLVQNNFYHMAEWILK